MKSFDQIIIGTGQATGTLLGKLLETGQDIAVIEGGKVGGSCVNYGCTPTKTLVASARAFHIANRGSFYGFEAKPRLDFTRVMDRMNEVRNESSDGLLNWMLGAENITVIPGFARFVSNRVIEVNGEEIEGENIYINVGTRPRVPAIKGMDDVNWLDSAGLLDLKELPEHLIIIGGGYIGVEFGQIFKRLGAEVTILQKAGQLMPREDEDIADSVQKVLEKEGVNIFLNTSTLELNNNGDSIAVTVTKNGEQQTIKGDQLLLGAGRLPNSDTLSLENTGISVNERGFIDVDDYCRTGVDGVFALGDVNGHGAFTHTSVNDAEIVLDYIFDGSRIISDRTMIYALFTDPALGRVGMSEKEAVAKGYKVLKAVRPMSRISRAKEMGETDGFAKLLVDGETDLILGAAVHGPGGDEIINMFAAILHSRIPCRDYRKVVLVHPTVSELMPWVLDGLEPIN